MRSLRLVSCLLLLFALASEASGVKLLRRPLSFVPAEQVLVLPRDQQNIVFDIMAVDQFLAPRPTLVTDAERRSLRQWLKRSGATAGEAAPGVSPQQFFLLTGHAERFDSIEHAYFHVLPGIIRNDSLPLNVRHDAAQRFLDTIGNICATDGKDNVFVNIYENATANIQLEKFRLTLDIISEYPEGPLVKLRVGGLPDGQIPFTLRLRLQHPDAPLPAFHINGRPIPSPVVEDSFLVISRKWRNNEEIFFYTEPVEPL